MGRIIINNIIRFVVLIVLQVALFKNIGYYNLATPFPYILFLFLLPIGIPNLLLYSVAFLTGLTVDAFYDTIGIHAAACVAFVWFRIFFHKITLEADLRNSFETPTWSEMGFKWYSTYILFGTLAHHLVLYLVEVFSFQNILYTLASVGLSSVFTITVIFIIGVLTYKRKSRLGN
ncbi:rod shape-determining protein MreD [Sphingobacterium olei]|uniref:Rod shape-determining protein MreD n=1 Tax=Sphingobacterium olei TaxID=2571155 RepID=A0A4U0P7P3_9SPHI|nr:rod shape-determining protein MreD [Sphingobacterium olei]TJZ62782.1 rod shape-determining protein MreD [Sphingobacterium olei]